MIFTLFAPTHGLVCLLRVLTGHVIDHGYEHVNCHSAFLFLRNYNEIDCKGDER